MGTEERAAQPPPSWLGSGPSSQPSLSSLLQDPSPPGSHPQGKTVGGQAELSHGHSFLFPVASRDHISFCCFFLFTQHTKGLTWNQWAPPQPLMEVRRWGSSGMQPLQAPEGLCGAAEWSGQPWPSWSPPMVVEETGSFMSPSLPFPSPNEGRLCRLFTPK